MLQEYAAVAAAAAVEVSYFVTRHAPPGDGERAFEEPGDRGVASLTRELAALVLQVRLDRHCSTLSEHHVTRTEQHTHGPDQK